ncbi:MmgE/PrpD family protein [compost metagenome]
MATATTFASGLQQAFRSDAMTKALHAGHAAQVGVQAAQAAAHGVNGVHDILEGDAGFGAALCGQPDWRDVTAGLGTDFNITRMTQKNHGCCGHTFAALRSCATTGWTRRALPPCAWRPTRWRSTSPAISSRPPPSRPASACLTWWRTACCTARCGSTPSSPSAWPTPPSAP